MDGEEKSSIAGDRFAQHHVPLGNLKLGYLCFEVADVPRWQRLLQGVIGMVPADDDALVFTHDHYQHRVSLSHGASDDITAAGWEVVMMLDLRRHRGAPRGGRGAAARGLGRPATGPARRAAGLLRGSRRESAPAFSGPPIVRARFNRPWCRAAFLPATPAWATCC